MTRNRPLLHLSSEWMLCQVPLWLELQKYLKVLTCGRSQCWPKHLEWRPQRPTGRAVVDRGKPVILPVICRFECCWGQVVPPGVSDAKSGAGIGTLQEARLWIV